MKNIENKKLPQILSFNMCKGPKKIWHHFGLFLSLFLAFHLKFLQLCKKPPSYISGTHQLLFPLVNNGQNWCQKLCKIFSPLLILQGECEQHYVSSRSGPSQLGPAQSASDHQITTSPHLEQIIRAIVVSRYTHYKYITGCDEWSIGMRWVKTVWHWHVAVNRLQSAPIFIN